MKFFKTFAAVTMIVSLLTVSAQGQTWRPRLYGCLEGEKDYAEINLRDYLVKTSNPSLNAAVEDDITQLDRLFGVRVSVYFPNDGLQDARFTPETNDELILRDDGDRRVQRTGTVLISLGFLEKEYWETNCSMMSLPAVLAHEFAHAMQHANSFPYGKGVRRELHADFMAGWYVAHRSRCRPQDPLAAFASFYRKGTNLGFFDPNHHGTSQDRATMMAAGYAYNIQTNDGSAFDAYNFGLRIVGSF
jgi:hypothetical protein